MQVSELTAEATQLLGQAEATQLLGQTPFQAPDIRVPSPPEEGMPAESTLTTETQERDGLPGLLTEANRITRGTSCSQ